MDKDTKIELLKIFAMVVVLVLLIIGIVWMNKEDSISTENQTDSEIVTDGEEEEAVEEDKTEETENSEVEESENSNATENAENSNEQNVSEEN